MSAKMHKTQTLLLQLSQTTDLSNLTLRQIGSLIGENHPQNVKHHLNQLIGKGLLASNLKYKPHTEFGSKALVNIDFVNIPIVGTANCGPATHIAEENLEGMLTVSKGILKNKNKVFAIQADGDSMNKANVNGKTVDNGDYVLVDGEKRSPQNGDYVLSIIDGYANIKRFYLDREHSQIMLKSESQLSIPPIFIAIEDFSDYIVAGEVFDVLKNSK